jgi:pentatricopeptide repeat protein
MLTGFCRPAFRRTFAPAPVLVVMLPKNAYSCACSVSLIHRKFPKKGSLPEGLEIQQKALGAEHLDVARTLNNLAGVFQRRGRYSTAEDSYHRVLAIQETKLGPEHVEVARTWNNLAKAYFGEGRLEEAESLYLRALALQEKTLETAHPDKAATLYNYTELLRKTHRKGEARKLVSRARQIDSQNGRERSTRYTVSLQDLRH